ncbi:MAG: glutamate racemase [Marinobacter sp.]|uniref:glutamate racemase n=1 Tax=Marinobacter sp. TaxID=50741 RepID=UPI0034A0881C
MRAPEILVFDSGVGGLSVAGCIRRQIPGAHLTYLADNACFPYGDQPEELVSARCVSLVQQARRYHPVDVVVIACNTASTVVLPSLRTATDIPVVGVVPAIKPAAGLSQNGRIGLLATPATVKRAYLEQLVSEFAADCIVERVGHPDLVRWIEAWVAGASLPEAQLSAALEPFKAASVDTVVLGCTHYPLILDTLKNLLPDVRYWIDSGEAIARRTVHLLAEDGFGSETVLSGAALQEVWFTGEVPTGIEGYLEKVGLPAARIVGHWPETKSSVVVG